MTFLGKEWLGVTGLGSSACKIPSCFQSGSAELAPALIRGGGSNPSDLRRRLGSAELQLLRQTQNPLPAMAADRSYSLSGYGGGPDRCVVKVPGIVPGKIPKPASISGKTTKPMVRYEEDASDPTAIWRIATAANHKADRVQQQKGDFQKVMTELHESMDRVEALLRRSVEDLCQINLNSTQGIQLMSTTEGNFKFPSTYPSVVVTGWGEDSNEVDEIQKDESALKGTDAKTKSNDPTEAPSQPVETGDMAQINIISKRGVQIHGIPDGNSNSPSTGYSAVPNCWGQSQLPLVFVASPTLNKLNPNSEPLVEALDSPELVGGEPLVGRADKRLRCTGLFWKLPPWPGFCALVFDRFSQHSDYKVLVNSHSVKQYNHIHSVLDYTYKFKELVKIWPFVNEAASDTLEDTIKHAIDYSITWPVRKVIPLIFGDYNELELKSVGTLVVNLMQARELTNKDADIQSVTVKIYDNDGIQEYELLVSGGTQQVVRVWDPGRSKNMRWHSSPLGVGGGLTFDVVLAAGRAQTLPKIHHCYFIRLTLEYCKFSSLDSYEFHACKFNNPKHRHYVILSKNIIATYIIYGAILIRQPTEFSPLQFNVVYCSEGYTGNAIVYFTKDWIGFKYALAFQNYLKSKRFCKMDWNETKQQGQYIYGWPAEKEDYKSGDPVGRFLSGNGDLKTVADLEHDMSHKNWGKEMALVPLILLSMELFSTEDSVKGFIMFLESAKGTALDTMDTSDELGLFLAMAKRSVDSAQLKRIRLIMMPLRQDLSRIRNIALISSCLSTRNYLLYKLGDLINYLSILEAVFVPVLKIIFSIGFDNANKPLWSFCINLFQDLISIKFRHMASSGESLCVPLNQNWLSQSYMHLKTLRDIQHIKWLSWVVTSFDFQLEILGSTVNPELLQNMTHEKMVIVMDYATQIFWLLLQGVRVDCKAKFTYSNIQVCITKACQLVKKVFLDLVRKQNSDNCAVLVQFSLQIMKVIAEELYHSLLASEQYGICLDIEHKREMKNAEYSPQISYPKIRLLSYKEVVSPAVYMTAVSLSMVAQLTGEMSHGHADQLALVLCSSDFPENALGGIYGVLNHKKYLYVKSVQHPDIWKGKTQKSVEDVPCGNLFVMVGLDQFITNNATLTNEKAYSGKFHSHYQFFYFDSVESLPTSPLVLKDLKPLNNSCDAQISVFGSKFQKMRRDANVFVVGSDTLGCEFLKNLALMGVSCGHKGTLIFIHEDFIAKSNWSRQSLCLDWNIGLAKSTVAAVAACATNSCLHTDILQNRACPETEYVFPLHSGRPLILSLMHLITSRLGCIWYCIGFLINILEDKYVVEGKVLSEPANLAELKKERSLKGITFHCVLLVSSDGLDADLRRSGNLNAPDYFQQ